MGTVEGEDGVDNSPLTKKESVTVAFLSVTDNSLESPHLQVGEC